MRCRCCDKVKTTFWKGDYYCKECITSINETIHESKTQGELTTPYDGHAGSSVFGPSYYNRKTKITLAEPPTKKE